MAAERAVKPRDFIQTGFGALAQRQKDVVDQEVAQKRQMRGGIPELVHLGRHAEDLGGVIGAPAAIAVGEKRHRNAPRPRLARQNQRLPGVTTRLENRQTGVFGRVRFGQHFREIARRKIDALHPGADILHLRGEVLRQTALGLEARHQHPPGPGKPQGHPLPILGPGQFVNPHQPGDLGFQPLRQPFVALIRGAAQRVQPVLDQPGLIADVIAQMVLEILEIRIADGAAEPADADLANLNPGRQRRRRLEGQVLKLRQHEMRNRPHRRRAGLGGQGKPRAQGLLVGLGQDRLRESMSAFCHKDFGCIYIASAKPGPGRKNRGPARPVPRLQAAARKRAPPAKPDFRRRTRENIASGAG